MLGLGGVVLVGRADGLDRCHVDHVEVEVEVRFTEQGDGVVSLGVPVEHDVIECGPLRLIGEGEHQHQRGVGVRWG
jgi:hypothetical protein